MTVRVWLTAALAAAALLLAGETMAQESPGAAAPPATDGASEAPAKPKPRPKPKPKPKPAPKAGTGSEPKTSKSKMSEPAAPELRTRAEEPHPSAAGEPLSASPSQGAFAAPPVACEPGQSVLYDGPKDFAVWVTRTGAVTIDNPLRPLTPDVTRVLQLVIGDKLATAYGRDLTALRRGASPAALEGLLGGPIRWDAALGSLPDTLDIVSDSGAPLAQMRFKECGTAPAAKAPPAPVSKKERKPRPTQKVPATETAGSPSPGSPGRAASPKPASPQRQFNLPQGAIPQ